MVHSLLIDGMNELVTFGVHLKGGEKGLEQSRELIYGPSEHT
jgi:hypothetical protein